MRVSLQSKWRPKEQEVTGEKRDIEATVRARRQAVYAPDAFPRKAAGGCVGFSHVLTSKAVSVIVTRLAWHCCRIFRAWMRSGSTCLHFAR